MYGVIYKITNNLNGMIYIGQTKQKLNARISKHKTGKQYIDRMIQDIGWENFTVEVLEESESREQLNEREKFWIAHFNCKIPNGYNLTSGGAGSAEITDETRAKLSAIRKGVPKSLEHRLKIGAAHKGKHVSAETRKKLSSSRKGKKHSKETIARMSAERTNDKNAFFGKHHSHETCMKISASNRHESPFKNLLAELDKRQLSYSELAKILRVSQPAISAKMRGKIRFTARDKVKLAEIFGLPAEYLFAT